MKTFRNSRFLKFLLLLCIINSAVSCTSVQRPHRGRFPFNMTEGAPNPKRTLIKSTEMTSAPMEQIGFYFPGEDSTTIEISKLQAGDVIGFVMSHREAWTHLKDAKVQKVPYEIFRFGHVAVVTSEHTLLSVCMGQPVTDDIPVSSLADQSWFAFRPPSGSVDRDRLDEFVSLVTEKAASKQAYDFTGAFGLWNVDSSPEAPNEIAAEYTCATLVVAALHYSGYHMDAVHRGGILDIVTPRQVIDSHGWTGRSL